MHDLPARAQAAFSCLEDSSQTASQRIEAAWEHVADCDLTTYPERAQPVLRESLSILESIAAGPEDREAADHIELLSAFATGLRQLVELALQGEEMASLDRQIEIGAQQQHFLIGLHLLDGKGSKSVAHRLRDILGSKRQALETVRAVDQDLRSRFGKDYAKLPEAELRALEDEWRREFGYSEGLEEL